MKTLLIVAASIAAAPSLHADFSVKEAGERLEILDDGKLVFAWQRKPLTKPVGGDKFAASAFIHPLATPSGFVVTAVQPSDHLHHLGVWWPWKFVTVGGKKYTTWELQYGSGRHLALDTKVTGKSADSVTLSTRSQVQIKVGEDYQPAIEEQATIRFSRLGENAYLLDVAIRHQAAKDQKVEVTQNHYSGFSWRGTEEWNARNVTMLASGGEGQATANGKPADWFLTTGPTPAGKASVLIMSGASKDRHPVEKLRIWDPNTHHGTPFINFNPVVDGSLPTDAPSIASRRYRMVISDDELSPEKVASLWADWKK